MIICVLIEIAAKADGVLDSKDATCPCNYHLVKLYIGDNVHRPGDTQFLGPDFDWYRQDSNGKWSSKHGYLPVGQQVTDTDADAHSWGYFTFCGTMCAPNKGGER